MAEPKRSRKSNAKSKKSKRIRQEQEVDKKAKELTSLIFGGGTEGNHDNAIEQEADFFKKRSTPTSLLSKSAPKDLDDGDDSSPKDDDSGDGESSEESSAKKPVAAWEDDDNVTIQITAGSQDRLKKLRDKRQDTNWVQSELEQRLRERYQKTTVRTSRTNWAAVDPKGSKEKSIDEQEEDVDDENLLESESGVLFAKNRSRIPANIIEMVRLKDANEQDPCGAVLRSLSFYQKSDPDEPLLMTAGLDKTIRFFQVGEEESKKVHGIHCKSVIEKGHTFRYGAILTAIVVPKMPIYKASFLPETNSVLATGRRPFFYFYDMTAGKIDLVPQIMGREEKSWESHTVSPDGKTIAFLGNDGYVVLLDPHSKQSTGFLKMNGSVRSIAFTPDNTELLASGSDGIINRFDIGTRRCIESFSNNDGTVTSSLEASGSHIAAGAESGVVNLYPSAKESFGKRTPLRSIMNISTNVDCMRFNHDGQILAMSSRFSSNCLKLLHVPSKTVFANWPTSKTPLNYVFAMDFAPKSRFLAIGNDKGRCLLYKLRHYHDS